jgi:hypothetical protein
MFSTRQPVQSALIAATVAAAAPVHADASFATGGYAREIVGEASGEPGVYRIAGYPWYSGGCKSDGWRAPDLRG